MLNLTIAFSKNPRLAPLVDGAVTPQNITLNFVQIHPAELFFRNLKYDEFDVTEMSISDFLIARERNDGTRWQWSALPVFLLKAFLWLNTYVNNRSQIESAADLKGKRVGVPDYQMTAALWMRIVLEELYGIEHRDVHWHIGRTKDVSHGVLLGLDKDPPPGVSLYWLGEDQTLDKMLDEGQIDAAWGFAPHYERGTENFKSIDRYGGTPIVGNPRIRRLFPDGGKNIITEYYKKTGIFPVNHMVVVKKHILEKYPWVALELYKAFSRSKELAFEHARTVGAGYFFFVEELVKQQSALFGSDPYPLGIRANAKMLKVLIEASFTEGLTKKLARIEEIFYPTTLDT
jgi:4,5-dihydroxyphthalate decarboxylase